ncbi:hypothetical protein V5799_022371 [Amblyomma americanum]|uniref:Uncharacterized protein n=1 Tax=Amblyomma americanum TaxID=6943 RepID=A0AAQ4FM55_AMBAM
MEDLLVNPYDEMRRSLHIIRDCLMESHNIARVLVACLANVQQYIDVVDYAKDFEKMGGFQVFPELLDYPSSLVRIETCALIAELVQNNPHCQRAALLSTRRLLRLLDSEPDDEVRCKALYALSCMVRQNKAAYGSFEKLGGPVLLRKILFEATNRQGYFPPVPCNLSRREASMAIAYECERGCDRSAHNGGLMHAPVK